MLAGCQPSATTSGQLPTVPADIQACFRAGPVKVPPKALTVAEVESLCANSETCRPLIPE
jgi:hypothetical protein